MILQKITTLTEFNKWGQTDPELLRLKEAHFFWKWPIYDQLFNDIERTCKKNKGGIFIIRGPRQVGKSSLIKKVSSRLFEDSIIKTLFFLRGDLISGYKELYDLIKECVNGLTKVTPVLFVIDEVTFITEWQRAIKALVDERFIKSANFLITGSNAYDLKSALELFPGRRGEGKDYVLLPMDFSEFIKYSSIKKSKADLFDLYLQLGGFPHSLNEYLIHGNNNESKNIYLSWIKGDILKAKKNDDLLRELLGAIVTTGVTPVSFDALKKKTSFGSHNTVQDYLMFLQGAFVINQVQRINPGIWTYNPKKNRKIYFRDPLIYTISRDWPLIKLRFENNLGYLYETLIVEKLKRNTDIKFGYYRNKNEKEIDFYSEDFAIEVKASRQCNPEDLVLLASIKTQNKFFIYSGPTKIVPDGINLISIWDFLSDF